MVDRPMAKSKRLELPPRHDAVLALGQRGDRPVGWAASGMYFKVDAARRTHGRILARKCARVSRGVCRKTATV